ncbi:hypothetical protein JCM19302_2744 [Jejuia pallidilutea]|uniref:Uncharacterized protein n=1 Tax=Jejuia pallidilutea TaxID=504487 RepID=A0A090W3Y7_9FLAO|nr:hypothetical protein JCM19302_2744 [Jejuia pallidilutea]
MISKENVNNETPTSAGVVAVKVDDLTVATTTNPCFGISI